jgi:hypothetical protein
LILPTAGQRDGDDRQQQSKAHSPRTPIYFDRRTVILYRRLGGCQPRGIAVSSGRESVFCQAGESAVCYVPTFRGRDGPNLICPLLGPASDKQTQREEGRCPSTAI